MKTEIIVLAILGMLIAGCNRKKPSEVASTTESSEVAEARLDEDQLGVEIGRGLQEQFNVVKIPIGEIEVMSDLSSQVEKSDFERKRFKSDVIPWLARLKDKGLLTLTEQSQSQLDAINRMGARTFNVSPTDLAKQHRDEKLSTAQYLALRTANCQVRGIVRNSPYTSPLLPQSEEFRLVLGTYRCNGIPWFKAISPDGKDAEYKFRALVKLNPFTKRYSFHVADWGDPQKDGWKSNNIQ